MKLFAVYLLLFISSCSFGQPLIIDSGVVLKKGIYKNFEEFKHNNPSIDFGGEVYVASRMYGKTLRNYYESFRPVVDRKTDKLLRDAYGFSDGKKVYIRRPNGFDQRNFNKVIKLGIFSYFNEERPKLTPLPFFFFFGAAGMMAGMMTGFGSEERYGEIINMALDFNTGDQFLINKFTMEYLFKEDTAFYNQFMNDKKPDLINYVNLYNAKHKTDGLYALDPPMSFEEASAFIKRQEADSTLETYYTRLFHKLRRNIAFKQVMIDRINYPDGKIQSIGMRARHKFPNAKDMDYKIGTWYYCYENGSLKEETEYNLTEDKIHVLKYNRKGDVIK